MSRRAALGGKIRLRMAFCRQAAHRRWCPAL